VNQTKLDQALERLEFAKELGFGFREALVVALTTCAASAELNTAIDSATRYGPPVPFTEEHLDVLVALSRAHPQATPEQVAELALQQPFINAIEEVRAGDRSLSYSEAMVLAVEEFPKEYAQYQKVTGQRPRSRR
jgi:hypothetical protein